MDVLDPSPYLPLPRTMWLLHRALLARPQLTESELVEAVCPPVMRDSTPGQGGHVRRALAALQEFGLVTAEHDALLRAEDTPDVRGFIRMLRRRVVVPPVDVSPTFVGAPDLRKGLVWLMRQSPVEPLAWDENVEVLLMPSGLFTNDTRWNGFRAWAGTLGFSQNALTELSKPRPGRTALRIVPSPTAAIIDAIKMPFGSPLLQGEALNINELLRHLRAELPVLPGHPAASYDGLPTNDTGIGSALSLALQCAESRGLLKLGYQSDATGAVAFPDPADPTRPRYVSNVIIAGKPK